MTLRNLQHIFLVLTLSACVLAIVSCNSKTTDDEADIVVTPASVAVKNFKINANSSVMANLDSVFFSIDLETGVIFNADSLPKGTDVSRLVASITFANTMNKAELTFTKDNLSDTTINYLQNATDSIDFTYPVKLDVTAQDGVNTFTYTIKVNVHAQEPDSLVWDKISSSALPARFANPVAQKTLYNKTEETIYTLIEEYNGEYTLATCGDLDEASWNKTVFSPGFNPSIESFTSTSDSYYLMDTDGNVYSSENMNSWTSTGETWKSILGAYGDKILGIKQVAAGLVHVEYPSSGDSAELPVAAGFPISKSSPLGVLETEWADKPIAFLACGENEEGVYTSDVWAFDGTGWAVINSSKLPEVVSPMMARYVVYRSTQYAFKKRAFDVWLLLGGMSATGEMNRDIYISYDNGVNWAKASQQIQLPEFVPALEGGDVIVVASDLTADLSDAWTLPAEEPTRASYSIEGFDITWECPYMYIFGGYLSSPSGPLNTDIWRGVIERLKFIPEI